jgi:hypothetical protein
MQWSLTSQSQGSVSQREQLVIGKNHVLKRIFKNFQAGNFEDKNVFRNFAVEQLHYIIDSNGRRCDDIFFFSTGSAILFPVGFCYRQVAMLLR